MIRISDITVRFGGVVALDGITADIADDVVGIIGPNGAGKTTLINVLSGFVRPETGSVDVDGLDLLTLSPFRRARWGLSRSFQKVRTAVELSVDNLVRVGLDSCDLPGADKEAAIERALEFTGLSRQRDTRAGDLNSKQQRMVEIARCLVNSPRIVLLDEPGGGMGEAEAEALRTIITGIRADFGAQVLLIDHDVDLIRATCSKTIVLDFGKLIAFGATEAVLRDKMVQAAYLGTGADQ